MKATRRGSTDVRSAPRSVGHAVLALLAVLVVLAVPGCSMGSPLTEILVVVDSDLAVPTEIDTIEVDATGPSGRLEHASAPLTGPLALDLPISLGLVHRGGPLGPIDVTARARLMDGAVVERRGVVTFVPGRTVVLRLDLMSSCVGVVCATGDTCADGTCGPTVPPVLIELDGGVGRLDACGSTERCNGADDDCDGRADEGIDRMTDRANCGRCGNACAAGQACVLGACALACGPDLGDCDGNATNGCETSLGTSLDCGACGAGCEDPTPLCGIVGAGRGCVDTCRAPTPDRCGSLCVDLTSSALHCGVCERACPSATRSRAVCTAGECSMRCDSGYGDCDGSFASGCETPLASLADCGACATECTLPRASVTCFTGSCEIVDCAPGWGNCDAMLATGCESPLNTGANCGVCGVPCAPANATASCATGTCNVGACDPGFGDCDGARANGCEADLRTPGACGGCGRACVLANATPRCAAGAACEIASCDTGFADCNGVPDDGCETATTTLGDCGACGRVCALANASETCGTGTCAVVSCEPDFADCNGIEADGCEIALTTATDCGGCAAACPAATPVCAIVLGAPTCRGGCTGSDVLCGTSCVDTRTEPRHCGGCSMPCVLPNATAGCAASACTLSSCAPSFADCNGIVGDGCEVPTDTLSDCGACGVSCSLANAVESCASGSCALVSCEAGFRDCNGVPSDGCERAIDTLSDCGACGVACDLPSASENCSSGTCSLVSCAAGFADCDGLSADGCEARLDTLTDCAACGASCDLLNSSESCATGTCVVTTCSAGFGDCDGVDATGCEEALTTLLDCGSCGSTCGPLANATATCASGACAVATCDPGFGDCDRLAGNGCERSLSTLSDCGGCGVACSLVDATESCATASCRVTACSAGRGNCDGLDSNGCETNLDTDPAHCGACPTACTTGGCAGGVCSGGVCPMGFGDCNLMSADGCERALNTLTDCGACGATCDLSNASESCATGTCTLGTCATNFGNCNMLASDGCEASLTTLTRCGACMSVCDLAHASESCSGAGVCMLGTCEAGWGSCDGNPANGCERQLNTLSSCGGCGVACPAGAHTTSRACTTGTCVISCAAGWLNCNGLAADGCEVAEATGCP